MSLTELFQALLALAAILLPLFLAWALLVWHSMDRRHSSAAARADDARDRSRSSRKP